MAAFRKVVAEVFGYSRTEVIRDRSRCARTRSEHCECGACDFFTTDVVKGRKLFDWCVKNANDLGIQSVIFNRRVVGFGNPNERSYTGPSPHTDHVHIGLKRNARRTLTREKVRGKITGAEEDWFDMATKQELKDAMREVLTEELAKDKWGILKPLYLHLTVPNPDGGYMQGVDAIYDVVTKP
jgi:hypothetical protein